MTASARPKVPPLVGVREAAEILGVERPRINRWRGSGVMPEPIQELACGPIWLQQDVEDLRDRKAAERNSHHG